MKDESKHILVVGASASIGCEIVERFVSDGTHVLATYNKNVPDITTNTLVKTASLDLLSLDSQDTFVNENIVDFGTLDIAIFLAGVLPGKALDEYDDLTVHEVMQVNFTSQVTLLRRLKPHFREGAQVLFLSSISGDRGSFDPVYAASKAAQNALVKSLATWWAPGLRVNAVAPALIEDSKMFDSMRPERRKHHESSTPTGRLTSKEEIAGVVFDICGPSWANLNGQIIHINGGVYV